MKNNLATVRIEQLTGTALDWAVAKAVGARGIRVRGSRITCDVGLDSYLGCWSPSESWDQAGPLIAKHRVSITPCRVQPGSFGYRMTGCSECWKAEQVASGTGSILGPTALIAAMRAIVTTVLGRGSGLYHEIEIPAELAGGAA